MKLFLTKDACFMLCQNCGNIIFFSDKDLQKTFEKIDEKAEIICDLCYIEENINMLEEESERIFSRDLS